MRKQIHKLIIAFGFLVSIPPANSSATNGCLRLFCIDKQTREGDSTEVCQNRDSVMIDTCFGSDTYNSLYSKKWFKIRFHNYVINLFQAPYDTLLEVSWTNIDTMFTSLRSSFSILEDKYGTFFLRKYAPNLTDSTDPASHVYDIRFSTYVPVDSILNDLRNISGLDSYSFSSYPGFLDDVLEKKSGRNEILVVPNPATNSIEVKCDLISDNQSHIISVFDPIGNVVLNERINSSNSNIDISHLPNNFYILKIDSFSKINLIIRK
jgi:hypothetical protein